MQEVILKGSSTVFQSLDEKTFEKINDYANAITFLKNFVVKEKLRVREEEIIAKAQSMMTSKQIVYKGNQRFNIEEIEFADSAMLTKKGNKGVRRNSKNHSAKRGSNWYVEQLRL